ncbi:hypothetical protein, partial [Nodularia spumigena]|uniref:hypothetical protein n=1 Tax=Nodularia spumigena TaxID=70799 RepID=UPI002B1FF1F9
RQIDTLPFAPRRFTNPAAVALAERLAVAEAEVGEQSLWSAIWTSEFWSALGETLLGLGKELWLGSLLIGVVMGLPLALLPLWAVKAYRRASGT